MKAFYKFFFLSLVILAANTAAFSQNKDYLDAIAQKSCDCFSKALKEKDGNKEAVTMQIGLCMMKAAQPYNAQLKKDHGIDLLGGKDMNSEGEKLGRIVGMKMLSFCPDVLVAVSEFNGGDEEAEPIKTFEGEVVSIQDQQFVVFTVKDSNGKTNNFLWLTYFQSTPTLTDNYRKILNKQVSITYQEMELYDPRIKELKKYNVINGLTAQ
ncbi:hypothetical protein [Rufibacter roseus]|uniref:Uncharacterized protein n=1 Tax=Rufibacter roseus TaxID=1567108 RepID=A0ABW2DFM1_9BACT|nr:hypothetical protein [Rufibacter roseus]